MGSENGHKENTEGVGASSGKAEKVSDFKPKDLQLSPLASYAKIGKSLSLSGSPQ
jgi:hypothetical protein